MRVLRASTILKDFEGIRRLERYLGSDQFYFQKADSSCSVYEPFASSYFQPLFNHIKPLNPCLCQQEESHSQ